MVGILQQTNFDGNEACQKNVRLDIFNRFEQRMGK